MAHEVRDPGEGMPPEPLLSVGGLVTLATTVLMLLVALGIDISDDVQAKVLAVVGVAAPLVVAVIGRRLVYSPRTVARLLGRRPPKSASVTDQAPR